MDLISTAERVLKAGDEAKRRAYRIVHHDEDEGGRGKEKVGDHSNGSRSTLQRRRSIGNAPEQASSRGSGLQSGAVGEEEDTPPGGAGSPPAFHFADSAVAALPLGIGGSITSTLPPHAPDTRHADTHHTDRMRRLLSVWDREGKGAVSPAQLR